MQARGKYTLPHHNEPSIPLASINILYQDIDRSYGLIELSTCIVFHSVDKLLRKAVTE